RRPHPRRREHVLLLEERQEEITHRNRHADPRSRDRDGHHVGRLAVKVVIAWLCLVAVAISCSIKHASEQYECDSNDDCAALGDNRVCGGGICVVPGGENPKDGGIDSRPPDAPPDGQMLVCPPQCTSCNLEKKECVIDCNQNATTCASQIT